MHLAPLPLAAFNFLRRKLKSPTAVRRFIQLYLQSVTSSLSLYSNILRERCMAKKLWITSVSSFFMFTHSHILLFSILTFSYFYIHVFYRTRVLSFAMLVTHWLNHWLTDSLTNCRLVNLMPVNDAVCCLHLAKAIKLSIIGYACH